MQSPTSLFRSSGALGLLLVGGLFSACSLPQVEVMPRYGWTSLSGDIGANSGNVNAKADLEDSGLDETEGTPGVRADFKFGAPHFVFQYAGVNFDGNGEVDATLDAGGVTIPAGADVATKLDLDIYSGVFLFDVFPGSMVEIALGFGGTVLDFDFRVEDDLTGERIKSAETVPVPLLAANVGVQLGSFEISSTVSGAYVDYGKGDGSIIDSDTFGRVRIFGGKNHIRASLVGGVRYIWINADYSDSGDDFELDLNLLSPYVGLEITL